MAALESKAPLAVLDDTLFPSDGSHYRAAQLQTIWKIFGIADPIVPDMKHLGRIDELVENRNAIAHGRRTPEDVGRSYSSLELDSRIDDVQAIANHLLDTMQRHFSSGAIRR